MRADDSGNDGANLGNSVDLGLEYHLTGGVVASYYGDPRFTQDLDLVIRLTADQPETKMLLNRLSSGIHCQ